MALPYHSNPNAIEVRLMNDKKRKHWEQIASRHWPWNNINDLKKSTDFGDLYPRDGPGRSPYASKLALMTIERMFSVFERVRIEAINGGGDIPIEQAMVFAQMYREAIIFVANVVAESKHDGSGDDAFENAVFVGNVIWGLVESIFMRPSNRSIVADLVEWANTTFGIAQEQFAEIQKMNSFGSKRIEEQDLFWEAIINQILVGQFRSAANILEMSSDYRNNTSFQRMVGILQLFDYHQLHVEKSVPKFNYALKEVQKNAKYFENNEPLKFICNLLMGDIETFEAISNRLSKPWYEVLPAYILFKTPEATFYDLSKCAKDLHSVIGKPSEDGIIGDIILDLMKTEWIRAMKTLASVKSMLWISAHLFDLILKTAKDVCTEEIEDLRDEVFIQFSKELFKTKGSIPLLRPAVEYVMSTKLFKHDYIEPILIIIAEDDHFESMELLEEILSICKENGLYEAYSEITRAMAIYALREGNWQGGVIAACRNEGRQLMDMVAHFIMIHAPPSEIKNCIDLDAFESTVAHSDMMLFLLHYNHFHKAVKNGNIAECTRLLHHIIISNLAPQEFLFILFDNLAQILDATYRSSDKTLLNKEAISTLQRCLAIYQKQSELRAAGSARKTEQTEEINRQLTYFHQVLCYAQARTAP